MPEFAPAAVKPPVSHAVLESIDDHTRTILAGLRQERQDLSVLIGRQALFVVNLEPRQMAGVVSEGMLFDIGYADRQSPVLAVPEGPVPDGTRAG